MTDPSFLVKDISQHRKEYATIENVQACIDLEYYAKGDNNSEEYRRIINIQ